MKLLITEEQVRFLMREFGELVTDRNTWIDGVYQWTDKPFFEYSTNEIIAYGEDGEYLGYWDEEEGLGFVSTEYVEGYEDFYGESISPEVMQDLESFYGNELKLKRLI